ncbi:MAG: RsmB/NOP family class I SAM-dependent RNA methyltransferase [Candidatus Helarchaeota archaeon]|nr:RsmB/NOP family class I SAM-dependent RNA methyltransferase [Candidatus Helarchaeota archaeon]
MSASTHSHIKDILDLIVLFLDKKSGPPPSHSIMNPQIFHYYKEIVRVWNQLNFIYRTTLLSLDAAAKYENFIDPILNATHLYAIYRIHWENAPLISIQDELDAFLSPIFKEQFLAFLAKLKTFSWKRALSKKSKIEILSLTETTPSFVIEHLQPVMSYKFLKANLRTMNSINNNFEFTIRVNTISEISAKILSNLKQDGIPFRQDQHIPELLHVPYKMRSRLLQNKWYKSGLLIVQDKASAAVVDILAPQPEELIGDLCAAPGIKTSFIAQKVKNSAKIYALDFHTPRTQQMKKILSNLQVINTQIINCDSINTPVRLDFLFDRVLLDAPCTGSGTFLTNPELKWRQTTSFLRQNTQLQQNLLKTAIRILKSKGTLVYSTCSLYPEEGELQILKFLDKLEPLELPEWIAPSYNIKNSPIPGTGRFFPALHHTQGFFLAKFKKR